MSRTNVLETLWPRHNARGMLPTKLSSASQKTTSQTRMRAARTGPHRLRRSARRSWLRLAAEAPRIDSPFGDKETSQWRPFGARLSNPRFRNLAFACAEHEREPRTGAP